MGCAILGFWALPNTVCERGFQAIEVVAHQVQVIIEDHTGEVLAHALPHDACFTVMDAETFGYQNRRDMDGEPFDLPFKFFVAGKRQVVGIAGIFSADGFRESSDRRQSTR